MIFETMDRIVENCKNLLKAKYGDKLVNLVLFGSRARKDHTSESDLDLLILFRGEFDYFKVLREVIEILYPLQLESPFLISAKPAKYENFLKGTSQLYRNAKEEGVMI